MEITTLITWNGLVYLLYYGVNFGIDYLRFKNKNTEPSSTYDYKELLSESPTKVEIAETQVNPAPLSLESKQKTKSKKITSPVKITGPIKDQGLPFDVFMQNSKNFSSNINF